MNITQRVKTRILSQDKDHPENTAVALSVGEMADEIDDTGKLIANLYNLNPSNKNLIMLGKKIGAPRPGGVTDDEYRSLIQSQIIKNTSEITIMDIELFMIALVSSSRVIVHDHCDMTFGITIVGRLTPSERKLINEFSLVPEPAGVKFLGISETEVTVRMGKPMVRMGRSRIGGAT